MGDVINLNQYRKKKAREEKEKRAAENRAKHGSTQAERTRDQKRRARADKHLDGHKLEE